MAAAEPAPDPSSPARAQEPGRVPGDELDPAAAEAAASLAAASLVAASQAAASEAAASRTAVAAESGASGAAPAGRPALLGPGEQPPPVYRTRLPPSRTLTYGVRIGFLRGTGELRWRGETDRYRVELEARVAGLTMLRQSSEGGIDAAGLAPVRFLDQRARRSPQAANFRRDLGTITFSGPAVAWPLLPGSQDRLSLFIQLAAIVAGEPELRREGARILMVVAGARGDAAVWSFRCVGAESIDTGAGRVRALKFVRAARSEHDTSAEIWLDPELHYLPAHATLRHSAGAAEFDLLLQSVGPSTTP